MSTPPSGRIGALVREIAVIVAGVTLALGADALYDGFRDRAERDRILRSIDADLRVDSVTYADALGTGIELAGRAAPRLLALVEDPTGQVGRPELARLIREAGLFPGGVKESTTYLEMTASGSIGLIEDRALREALVSYYARPFAGIPPEMRAAYISDINGTYERSLRAHLGSGYIALMACFPASDRYEECLEQANVELDLARLRSDPVFVEQLVGVALWAGRFKNFVDRQASEQRELAARVRDAIGRP